MDKITRAQAKALGYKRYFTGKPCSKGHVAERYTGAGTCSECARIGLRSRADYYAARYAENSDSIRQRRRDHYYRDPAVAVEKTRAWQIANPEATRAYKRKNRASRRAATAKPAWYGEFDDFVFLEAESLKMLRKSATGIDWHIDHMIPLLSKTARGLHCADNIQVIPATLNLRKINRMILTSPLEWIREI